MNNASSALAAAGNSLDESIALLTAANVTVQNASKSSTAVRTITARLRNSKAELDELGEEVMTTAKYQQLLNTLTDNNVKIVDEATGKYNSTYEILRQLASVWGDLDDGIRATLTTQLAGVRNVDAFNSILANFKDTAEGAMNAMAGSAGSLEDAFKEFKNSVAGHLNELKAAWEGLATTAVNSGFVSTVIDQGRIIVSILTELVKVVNSLGGAWTLSVAGMGALIAKFLDIKSAVSGFNVAFNLARENGNNMFNSLSSGAAGFISKISLARAAIAGIFVAVQIIGIIRQKAEEARKEAIELSEETVKTSNKLAEVVNRYSDLYQSKDIEGIKSLQKEIADLVGEQADNLDLVNGKYEEQLDALKNLRLENAKDTENVQKLIAGYASATDGYYSTMYNTPLPELIETYKRGLENLQRREREGLSNFGRGSQAEAVRLLEEAEESLKKMNSAAMNIVNNNAFVRVMEDITDSTFDSKESINDFVDSAAKIVASDYYVSDALSKDIISYEEIKDAILAIINTEFPDKISEISKSMSVNVSAAEKYRKSLSDLSDAIENLKDGYDLYNKALKELAHGEGISYDTLKSLMSQYENYTDYLYESNGQLKVRIDLLKQEADAMYENDVASINKEIYSLNAERDQLLRAREEIDKQGNGADWAKTIIDGYDAQIEAIDKLIAADRSQLNLFEAIHNTVAEEAAGSGIKEAAKNIKEEEDALSSLSSVVSDVKNGFDILSKAREETAEGGKLSIGTIEDIIEATKDYAGLLEFENGEIKINEQAWQEYYTSKYNAALRDLQLENERRRQILEGEREVMMARSGSAGSDQRIKEIDAELAAMDQATESYAAWMDAVVSSLKKESEALQNASNLIDETSKSHSILAKAQEEMSDAGNLSYDTVENIISSYPEYIQFLSTENGFVVANTDALKEYVDQQNSLRIAKLNEDIIKAKEELNQLDRESEGYANKEAEIATLEQVLNLYETMVNFSEKEKDSTQALLDAMSSLSSNYSILTKARDEYNDTGKLSLDTIESIISETDNYLDILRVENGEIKLNEQAWKDYYTNKYKDAQADAESEKQRLEKQRSDIAKTLSTYTAGSKEFLDAIEELGSVDEKIANQDGIIKFFEAMFTSILSVTEATEELEEKVFSFVDALSALEGNFDILTKARKEMDESGQLSISTIEAIIESSENWTDYLIVENGHVKLNEEAWKDNHRTKVEIAREEIELQKSMLVAERSRIEGLMKLHAGESAFMEEYGKQIQGLNDSIGEIDKQLEVFDAASNAIMSGQEDLGESYKQSTAEFVSGEEQRSKALNDLSEAVANASKEYDAFSSAQKEMSDVGHLSADTVKSLLSESEDYFQFLEIENGQIKLNTEAFKDYIDAKNNAVIHNVDMQIAESARRLSELSGSAANIDEFEAENASMTFLVSLKEMYQTIFGIIEDGEEDVKSISDALKELDDAFSDASSAYDLLSTAQSEMNDEGGLTVETVRKILSLSEDYAQFLTIEGDKIRLNTDALREYLRVQNASNIKEINDEISELESADSEGNKERIDQLKQLRNLYKFLFDELADGTPVVRDVAEHLDDLKQSISDTEDAYELLSAAQKEMDDTGHLSLDTVQKILSQSDDYAQFLTVEGNQIRLNTEALKEYIDQQNRLKLADLAIDIRDAWVEMNSYKRGSDEWNEAKEKYDSLRNQLTLFRTALKSASEEQGEAEEETRSLSDALSEAADKYKILSDAQKEMSDTGGLSYDTVTNILSKYPEYIRFLTEENGKIKLNTEALKNYIDYQNKVELLDIRKQIESAYSELDALEFGSTGWLKKKMQIGGLERKYSLFETMFGSLGENEEDIKEISSYLGELKSSLSDVTSTYDILSAAQEEMSKSGTLSADTVERLLAVSDDYIQFLTVEHGMIKLNADALREYAESQYAAKILEITERLAGLRTELNSVENDSERSSEIERQIALLESEVAVYQTLFDTIGSGASTVAETSTYINDVRNSLDDLASVEEIVANGFVVAADKVKGLADVFPELFANVEAFADGSMKLDEDVTNAFLENRRLETNASIESKITELEAELETVTAKKEFVDAELQLLTDLAQGRADINKQEVEYRLSNAETLLNYLIDAGEDEATAYAIAAQSIADNTFDLDGAIATAAADIDHNYREAFASAADNSAANATAMNSNIATTASQAHQAALAVAGMISGKIQGSEGVINAGARGTKKIAAIKGATKVDAPSNNAARAMGAVRASAANTRITLVVGDFNGSTYTKTSEIKSLADLIIDRTNESNALELLKGQLEGQIALLRNLQKSDLSQFKDKAKTGSSSAGSGGSPSTAGSGSNGKGENPFDAMYREHQHLLAMEQESVSDYFAWLDKASKDAFAKGWITLDDLRKYEEEVYRGLKEIISDAESAMKDLVNFRVKMLEQQQKDQKVALETQLDVLKAFYDDQKKQLQEQREEEEYQKEKAEKQKAVTDIEAELAMLGYDNSAKAQKRRLELQQQLAEAQAAYGEFEKDHAYQLAEDALESAYEKQSAELQAQIDAIDAVLNDPNALFNQALEDIKNDTGSLYDEMVKFAEENGEGESTVKRLWENAFIATQDLQKVTSENVQTISELLRDLPSDIAKLITGFTMQNSTGYSYTSKDSTASTSAGSSTSGSSSTSGGGSSAKIPVGTAVKATGKAYSTVKGTGNAVDVTGKQLYVAQVWDNAANPYWQGDYTYAVAYSKGGSIIGWVRKDQLSGYASGTSFATAGMHRVDENGQEALFVSANGNHYRLLSDGDKVFNAQATDFLYRFANGDKDIFKDIFSGIFSKAALNNIANRQSIGDVRMGDIIINGNADKATVSEIRRAQRESVDSLLQQFGRLQRAAY